MLSRLVLDLLCSQVAPDLGIFLSQTQEELVCQPWAPMPSMRKTRHGDTFWIPALKWLKQEELKFEANLKETGGERNDILVKHALLFLNVSVVVNKGTAFLSVKIEKLKLKLKFSKLFLEKMLLSQWTVGLQFK